MAATAGQIVVDGGRDQRREVTGDEVMIQRLERQSRTRAGDRVLK